MFAKVGTWPLPEDNLPLSGIWIAEVMLQPDAANGGVALLAALDGGVPLRRSLGHSVIGAGAFQ